MPPDRPEQRLEHHPAHHSGPPPAGQVERTVRADQPARTGRGAARQRCLGALAAAASHPVALRPATPRSAAPQHPTPPMRPRPRPCGAAAAHNAYRSTGPTHPPSGSPQRPRPGSPAHRWRPSAQQRAPPCPAPAPQHAARAPPPSYPRQEAPSARTKSPTATAATSPHASARDHH